MNIVDYLFLSDVLTEEGELWTATLNGFLTCQYEINKDNTTAETRNPTVINMILKLIQMHGFLYIVSKGEMCVITRNPLWRSMLSFVKERNYSHCDKQCTVFFFCDVKLIKNWSCWYIIIGMSAFILSIIHQMYLSIRNSEGRIIRVDDLKYDQFYLNSASIVKCK